MRNRSLALEHLERRRLLDAKLVVDIGMQQSEIFFGQELSPMEIRDVVPFQDSLLFYVHYHGMSAEGDLDQAGRIWQTAGEGIEQPIDLNSVSLGPNTTASLGVTVGDKHFFLVEIEDYFAVLWSTVGSFGELSQNREVFEWTDWEGEASFPPENLTEFDGSMYVTAEEELWRVDGTTERVQRVKDINPSFFMESVYPFGSHPTSLTPVNQQLFFTADDGVHGRELWVTDGSEANTRIVRDIVPSHATSGGYEELASHNDLLFMSVHGIFSTASGCDCSVSDGICD